jgi:hypothetical protein
MPFRHKERSHEDHRATELNDVAEHTHRVAEQHGQQEHLTGPEQSRQALEHSREAQQQTQTATVGHGIAAFGHNDIAALAYDFWQARGCPEGSPDADWYRAVEELRSRTPDR